MTDRERDVMAVLTGSYHATGVARLLNLRWVRGEPRPRRCSWCPVGPFQKNPVRPAAVPRASRERVARVLRRLVRAGLVVKLAGVRRPLYAPAALLREMVASLDRHLKGAT